MHSSEKTGPRAATAKQQPVLGCHCCSFLKGLELGHESSSVPCRHEVLLEDCREALARHQPHIVLCCWMPLGADFTQAIRQTLTVKHYILVRPCRLLMCSLEQEGCLQRAERDLL